MTFHYAQGYKLQELLQYKWVFYGNHINTVEVNTKLT